MSTQTENCLNQQSTPSDVSLLLGLLGGSKLMGYFDRDSLPDFDDTANIPEEIQKLVYLMASALIDELGIDEEEEDYYSGRIQIDFDKQSIAVKWHDYVTSEEDFSAQVSCCEDMEKLCVELIKRGIGEVTGEYTGGGDSGDFDCISAFDAGGTEVSLGAEEMEVISNALDAAYSNLSYNLHDNDGGRATFSLNLVNSQDSDEEESEDGLTWNVRGAEYNEVAGETRIRRIRKKRFNTLFSKALVQVLKPQPALA